MAKTAVGAYNAVITDLRTRIGHGQITPGEFLPSEGEIATRYNVSRYSAREAVKRLAAEGLITVIDGKGSYVRARTQRARHEDTRALYHTSRVDAAGDAEGDSSDSRDGSPAGGLSDGEFAAWSPVEAPSTHRVNAGPDLALAMGVPEHTSMIGVDRLLTRQEASGDRRMMHRLTIPLDTVIRAPALADDPFRTPDALYAALHAAKLALAITEHVRATTATPDDITSLQLAPNTVLLVTRRLIRETGGATLALEETRRSAEDTQLAYTISPIPGPPLLNLAAPTTPQPNTHTPRQRTRRTRSSSQTSSS